MKTYTSKSFERRIQFNIAGISVGPNDEYKLIAAYYDIHTFECELCGHKNCIYAFEIENIQSGKTLKIGSECVKHFEGKGIDINVAQGLIARVKKASEKARRDLKSKLGNEAWDNLSEVEKSKVPWSQKKDFVKNLGNEAYKALPIDIKRELITREYLTLQAIDLLAGYSQNKSILSEDDVNLIMDLDMKDKMDRAKILRDKTLARERVLELRREVVNFIETADMKEITFDYLDGAKKEIHSLLPTYDTHFITSAYNNRVKRENLIRKMNEEYGWLLSYKGENEVLVNMIDSLSKHGCLSSHQVNLAKTCLEHEGKPKDVEFEKILEELYREQGDNSFIYSVYNFYKTRGYVTPKQKAAIEKTYKKQTV